MAIATDSIESKDSCVGAAILVRDDSGTDFLLTASSEVKSIKLLLSRSVGLGIRVLESLLKGNLAFLNVTKRSAVTASAGSDLIVHELGILDDRNSHRIRLDFLGWHGGQRHALSLEGDC